MNTYITRVWLNNSNNFVISDHPQEHADSVAKLVAEGGIKLESNGFSHGLGTVEIVRVEGDKS